MKYEIIVNDGKKEESFITEEYKLISPTGRLGHTIDKKDRTVIEIKFKPLGATKNKNYIRTRHTIIIREAETGRNIQTLEIFKYDKNGNSINK